MFYYIKIEEQIKRIFRITNILQQTTESQASLGNIEDFKDFSLYRNFLKSKFGSLINKREAFTLLLNTDGISLCDKSNLSLWPVFIVINELDKNIRFCVENVIIAGKL